MSMSDCWPRRQIASCLVMFLAVPFGEAAIARPQQAFPGQQAVGSHSVQPQSQNSNDGTGKPAANATQTTSPGDADSARSQTVDHNQQSGTSPSAPEQQQNSTSKPMGTAAAPYEKTMGVAASRPAGAVIAPAKQRRARSILIRLGVVLGAAVAVGTVVGLSKATSSRPN